MMDCCAWIMRVSWQRWGHAFCMCGRGVIILDGEVQVQMDGHLSWIKTTGCSILVESTNLRDASNPMTVGCSTSRFVESLLLSPGQVLGSSQCVPDTTLIRTGPAVSRAMVAKYRWRLLPRAFATDCFPLRLCFFSGPSSRVRSWSYGKCGTRRSKRIRCTLCDGGSWFSLRFIRDGDLLHVGWLVVCGWTLENGTSDHRSGTWLCLDCSLVRLHAHVKLLNRGPPLGESQSLRRKR
jgi:hypothetical protein